LLVVDLPGPASRRKPPCTELPDAQRMGRSCTIQVAQRRRRHRRPCRTLAGWRSRKARREAGCRPSWAPWTVIASVPAEPRRKPFHAGDKTPIFRPTIDDKGIRIEEPGRLGRRTCLSYPSSRLCPKIVKNRETQPTRMQKNGWIFHGKIEDHDSEENHFLLFRTQSSAWETPPPRSSASSGGVPPGGCQVSRVASVRRSRSFRGAVAFPKQELGYEEKKSMPVDRKVCSVLGRVIGKNRPLAIPTINPEYDACRLFCE